MEDLSKYHGPVGELFARPTTAEDWEKYRLSDEQVEFFRENGYLQGVRILTDEQVEALRGELEQLMDPAHAGRELFHEYHSNESTDPDRVVFHALGAWRVKPGFHDLLVEPGVPCAGIAIARGPGAILARPAFLQACAARRSGGVASGLFLLDAYDAAGSSDVLDWAGRFHSRERLLELCAGKPQMAGLAEARIDGGDGRNPQQLAG